MRSFKLSALVGMILLGWFLAAASSAAPTWPDIRQQIATNYPQIASITTAELAGWLDDQSRTGPVLLDVRSREEYEVSHLPGAVWAETNAQQRAALAGQPADRKVVFYCSVGWRSAIATEYWRNRGPRPVSNLDGSIFQWANEDRPLVGAKDQTTHAVHPYNRSWGALLDRLLWSHDPSG